MKNIREEFNISDHNISINELEELHKHAHYEDIPYIPEQDPRSINVAAKCSTPVVLPRVEDDFVYKNMLKNLGGHDSCIDKDTLDEFIEEYEETQRMQRLAGQFQSAIQAGGTVVVSETIRIREASAAAINMITRDTDIDFGDSKILLDIPDANSTTENWVGMAISGCNVVLDGNTGGIETANNPELYAIIVRKGANLTINGGRYIGGTTVIQASEGTVTINGGFYQAQIDDPRYTLNCIDAAYDAGKANIVVKGGTFVNFDPSNHSSENKVPTNFVAEGHKVVSEKQANGDIWYTVVAE